MSTDSTDSGLTDAERSKLAERSKFDAALTEILYARWWTKPNDLIGGWFIGNTDLPRSQYDYKQGHIEVGNFLTEELACYIVALHNMRIDKPGARDQS